MKTKYYFITVFQNYDDYRPRAMRCWDFYSNLEDAMDTVINNITDLWERCYNYAFIEEYKEGIGGYNWKRWFFKYDQSIDKYELIKEEPKELKYYAGFALG